MVLPINLSPAPRETHAYTSDRFIKIKTRSIVWHVLTLGLPLLLAKIMETVDHVFSRPTMGPVTEIHFSVDRILDAEDRQKFLRFFAPSPHKDEVRQDIKKRAKDKLAEIVTTHLRDKIPGQLFHPSPEVTSLTRVAHDKRTLHGRNEVQLCDDLHAELLQEQLGLLCSIFNSFQMIQYEKEIENKFHFSYRETFLAEVLSLSLAYTEGLEGKTIELPVYDAETEQYRLTGYQIHSFTLGDALPGYRLEPVDLSYMPWIVMRGTQQQIKQDASGRELRAASLESMMADGDEELCDAIINKSIAGKSSELESTFRVWKEKKIKVKLCGHSLGAALVTALTEEYHEVADTTFCFNAFGVTTARALNWESCHPKPTLLNFDAEGDVVPASGHRLIGRHFAIKALFESHKNPFLKIHSSKHLWKPFRICEIDVERENGKWQRKVIEFIRTLIGKILYYLTIIFNKERIPDWLKDRSINQLRADEVRRLRSYTNSGIMVTGPSLLR